MRAIMLIIILAFCGVVQSSKILAIVPSPYFSHQATFRPLWRELAKQGHELTLITANTFEENENITQIDFGEIYELFPVWRVHKDDMGFIEVVRNIYNHLDDYMKFHIAHPELTKLIKNREKFDLMIVEILMPLYTVLSEYFGCPIIGISSMDTFPFIHGAVGNDNHPSVYTFFYEKNTCLMDRVKSTLSNIALNAVVRGVFVPLCNFYVRKYVDAQLPSVFEVYRKVSLLFIHANPVLLEPRAVTPITINVHGIHLRAPQLLPKDIQDYLDSAKEGCIYFSFGSTVNSNYLTPEAIEIFRTVFEELAPVKVLWKFENETWGQKPKNVKIAKWLPQQDILRHPNVKVFITQGGLQSMEEAIDSAVPMLGMPFFGDQTNNVNKMVTKQFGLRLDVKTMDKESLKKSLLALLNDPLYKKNVDKYSAISKDQPMTGLEKAVWWTEYVLRHGGTEHLRSPSADIPLYQYFFLDIIAFLIVVLIFIVFVVYILIKSIKFIFRKLFGTKNKVKIN